MTKRIETKSNTVDLVTEYDQRIEEILIKQLREKFPTHKFVEFETKEEEKYFVLFNIDLLGKSRAQPDMKQH